MARMKDVQSLIDELRKALEKDRDKDSTAETCIVLSDAWFTGNGAVALMATARLLTDLDAQAAQWRQYIAWVDQGAAQLPLVADHRELPSVTHAEHQAAAWPHRLGDEFQWTDEGPQRFAPRD